VLPAILTAIFFACSAVVSQRLARIFGPVPANCYRLCIACAVLGLLTVVIDASRGAASLHAETFGGLYLSGLIGFGVGDIALFLAYARLGSRLTILINWCSAALFAAAGDWWMRGQGLLLPQWVAVAAIMAGLVVALWPAGEGRRRHPFSGVLFALIAGAGMGAGTVLSGQVNDAAHSLGLEIHGISQAFQRSTAGVTAAIVAFLFVKYLPAGRKEDRTKQWKHKPFWLISTALFGPVIGVSCYQWALLELESSAIVVAIAATSTLLVIPLARMVEKDIPGARQLAGTLLAAAGVIALKFFS
jgi:drug/metabolite transporter (DMT)-like permease